MRIRVASDRRLALALAIAAAAVMAMPAAALAQLPVDAQYEDEVVATQESVDPGPATAPGAVPGPTGAAPGPSDSDDGGGVLPFTGTDMLALFAVAISLASFGVVLHRLSSARRRDLHPD